MKVTVCDRNVVINMSVKLIKKERVAKSFLLLCYSALQVGCPCAKLNSDN